MEEDSPHQRFPHDLENEYFSSHTRKRGYRANASLRRKLRKRNQKLRRRIDNREGLFQSPAIRSTATKLELSEKTQAIGPQNAIYKTATAGYHNLS